MHLILAFFSHSVYSILVFRIRKVENSLNVSSSRIKFLFFHQMQFSSIRMYSVYLKHGTNSLALFCQRLIFKLEKLKPARHLTFSCWRILFMIKIAGNFFITCFRGSQIYISLYWIVIVIHISKNKSHANCHQCLQTFVDDLLYISIEKADDLA